VLDEDDDEEEEEPLVVDLAGEEDERNREGELKAKENEEMDALEEPLEPRAGLDSVVHESLAAVEPLMDAIKLEDGRSLLEWIKAAEEAGVAELWAEGRIGPLNLPIDVAKAYYSVKGFQGVVNLVTGQLAKPTTDMA